jgi:hypothetical protein
MFSKMIRKTLSKTFVISSISSLKTFLGVVDIAAMLFLLLMYGLNYSSGEWTELFVVANVNMKGSADNSSKGSKTLKYTSRIDSESYPNPLRIEVKFNSI